MTAFNGFPSATTAGQGLFQPGGSSNGVIQGQAYPDPATRYALRGGFVSGTETIPMFGGIGVTADLPAAAVGAAAQSRGQLLSRATSIANLTGFTVFDQSYNMVNDPNNPVPSAGSGQSINWYALGSRARIAVAASAELVDLFGDPINSQVSWDFTAQELIPYAPSYAQATITDAVWANTAGGQVTFTVGTDLTADLSAGSIIEVSGVINTGGVSTGVFNGQFVVVSVSSTTIVVVYLAAASPGTYASGGHVLAGGGALAVTLLEVFASGSMTVNNPALTGGLRTYNYNGSAAIIQLTGGTVA